MCTRGKCRWRSVPIGDDFELAENLAAAHSMLSHIEKYTWFIRRDNVLSTGELIELSFYTDYSGESVL